MILTTLIVISSVLAALPAYLLIRNLRYYSTPPLRSTEGVEVSVLIPARNEQAGIRDAVTSALASQGVGVEVIVLDDRSDDDTATIVQSLADLDDRVRLIPGPPLPAGWAGKQHACMELSRHARYPLLLFIDADVRLERDGIARFATFQRDSGAQLVSGVPRQITGTLAEKLVIPLIHFLLLGYLPIWIMRMFNYPALGAGCGQLFLATREGYDLVGGHESVRASFHDGVTLPRAFRRRGLMTDLCDATHIASCRMYHSAGQLWSGLAKNAGEGIGSLGGIVPWSVLLLGGGVAPFLFLACSASLAVHQRWPVGVACTLALLPRLIAAQRFQQSWLGAVLHPLGISLLIAIQWYALVCRAIGRPIGWKGRTQPTTMRGADHQETT